MDRVTSSHGFNSHHTDACQHTYYYRGPTKRDLRIPIKHGKGSKINLSPGHTCVKGELSPSNLSHITTYWHRSGMTN